jgi:hypothetical protein
MNDVLFGLLDNRGEHNSYLSRRDAQRVGLAQQHFLVFKHERYRHVSNDVSVQHEINDASGGTATTPQGGIEDVRIEDGVIIRTLRFVCEPLTEKLPCRSSCCSPA